MTLNEKKRFRSIVARCIRRNNIAGNILAIVWGMDSYAGICHDHQGMVVTQKQYGMGTYPFSVADGYLHFHGHKYHLPVL